MSKQKQKMEELAKEIAITFKDEKNINLYQRVCHEYDESIVHRAFQDTKKVPSDRIKKSRPALFLFLLKKNGK